MEMELQGAVMRFAFTFEALPNGQTSLAQHITLEGSRTGEYETVMEMFAKNISPGMERLADDMERFACSFRSQNDDGVILN